MDTSLIIRSFRFYILRAFVLTLFLTITDALAFKLEDKFKKSDAVLISEVGGDIVYEWQADTLLIPASLTKLVTAKLAIDRWGLKHRFHTEFYLQGETLWVKGFGDPYLVSEELDLIVKALRDEMLATEISVIAIDNNYFKAEKVPGQSTAVDPYNAPVSAIAANFNTVSLRKVAGEIKSAEPQTPLTPTAIRQASALSEPIGRSSERVNLKNTNNAQQHFAELLAIKLGSSEMEIKINQSVPSSAKLFYRHFNSHTLEDVLRGTLKFSNNFIANQVFLMLADVDAGSKSFAQASEQAKLRLRKAYAWQDMQLNDGSGLSRENRLSASQINELLCDLSDYKTLLKPYSIGKSQGATVYAKTGTLNGVHSFAGFVNINNADYQFVFIFNRSVPWRYREQLLERVIDGLAA